MIVHIIKKSTIVFNTHSWLLIRYKSGLERYGTVSSTWRVDCMLTHNVNSDIIEYNGDSLFHANLRRVTLTSLDKIIAYVNVNYNNNQ